MEKKKSLLLGFFIALLGGIIASIPYFLILLSADAIAGIVAALIPVGASFILHKYYKKKTRGTALVVILVTFVLITVSIAIITPLLAIYLNGGEIISYNIKIIYENKEFMGKIIRHLFYAYLFSTFVIYYIYRLYNPNKNDKKNLNINIDSSSPSTIQQNFYDISIQERNKIIINSYKSIFQKYSAMDKGNTIDKETIMKDINIPDIMLYFSNMRFQQIIRKHKGKYYYSEKAANNSLYRFLIIYGKMMLWVLLACIIVAIIAIALS